MSYEATYRTKKTTAAEATRFLRDGDTIVVPAGAGEPAGLLAALSEQRRSLSNIAVTGVLPMNALDLYDPETVQHVRYSSYFLGGPARKGAAEGWISSRANYFGEIPQLMRDGYVPVDVVFAVASPMDAHGWFSLSLGTDYTMEAIKLARVVVLEINPRAPFTYGNCHIHIDQVTALVEDDRPLATVGLPIIGESQKAIGGHVADLIPDNATLQIGFGAIPDAVVMQLTDRKNLGVHTEMFGDGILSLFECGAVNNRAKNFMPGIAPATFALGSDKLYEWMHLNRAIEMHPVDFTNDPYIAAQNDNLHTINGTIEIDLLGQCVSESIGPRPYSGTGGQVDFVRAGNRSKGGKSFIVLESTAKAGAISKIVPTLNVGAHVTTSKNDVNYVVTEYGVAQLRGKTNQERAAALIAIAHPNFREELGVKAQELHIL